MPEAILGNMQIRRMEENAIGGVAKVHYAVFGATQADSDKWIGCQSKAYPVNQFFVATANGHVVGYIFWREEDGFRRDPILQLVQMAVLPEYRGLHLGSRLVTESYERIKAELMSDGRNPPRRVLVKRARANEKAGALYETTLGALEEACLESFCSDDKDEVLMVARRGNGKI